MKPKIILLPFFVLLLFLTTRGYSQTKKTVEGPRWRVGLNIQYASSFKNVQINYPALNYTGILGGFTGKGLGIFGGYKLHKYLALEVETGILLNSYNRNYGQGIYIIGRFNKFYVQPGVKFIYPIIKNDNKTINICLGGGLGFVASGRLYLEDQYTGTRAITYARYDPMVAPFLTIGGELLLTNRSNITIGFKYQDGVFNATQYYDSTDPSQNIKTAPKNIKNLNAQGLGLMVGIIQEF
jgi:hypothetical protein